MDNLIGGGYMCANLHEIRYKFHRLHQTMQQIKTQNLSPDFVQKYLKLEINIFEEGLQELLDSTQMFADKMEDGLIRRKKFLESKDLEAEYQLFKSEQNTKQKI